jgi:hypothetical protein
MKDAATGFSFLAMCGLVSIGLFAIYIVYPYGYAVYEYALDVQAKADAHDEWKAQEPVFEEMAGMMLPVGRK